MVLCRTQYAKDLDRALFPGVQGGPLMHIIAAKAVCFKEAMEPGFVDYQRQIVANAQRLARGLSDAGFRLVSGGTDTHLMLVDVFSKGLTGQGRRKPALGKAGITVNKNAIPFDKNPPMVASGIRIGTPAVTSRGMREPEMDAIAGLHRPRARLARGREHTRVRASRSRGPVPEVPALSGNELAGVPSAAHLRAAVEDGVRARRPRSPVRCPASRRARGSCRWRPRSVTSSLMAAYSSPKRARAQARRSPTSFRQSSAASACSSPPEPKNLQEQIFFKICPVLQESLGVPFKATYMKGARQLPVPPSVRCLQGRRLGAISRLHPR
jgi:hypothetical protein